MSLRVLKERYEILRQLAKKAGRKILLARDLQTNELVVIKLLIFNSEIEWEELKLFQREAQILRNLSFSAIPSYIDFFEVALSNKKALAFVQSYIEAVSLEQHIQNKGTFSEIEVKQLAKFLLQILIYLHGQNPSVVHRDIKPSNILLTNRSGNSIGDVFLIDFGSVQTLTSSESDICTVVGTYGYMSPEQFGARAVAASDLYSLGATLIYLLTGKSPVDSPQKLGKFEVWRINNCSRELGKWLKKMVEPELEKRFKSAAEALNSLDKLSSTNLSDFSSNLSKKISIKKSADVIEITTPCRKDRESSIVHFIGTLNVAILYGMSSILLLPKIEAIFQPIFINHGLMNNYLLAATAILMAMLSIYVTIWLKIIVNMLFIPFGKKKLQIDKQRIYFSYKLLGLEYRYRPSIPRQAIIKLDSNTNKIPEVIIWLGIYKYSFGKGFLNTAQAAWLSRELRDWLDIKTI
ncbi:serine/threonine protein kinase [Rivularia sp. PCC 7116]|uniref:serine/threonine protein kinase n=1 Tax=Rivularia sp. PCC 7116 TaxID=373994 RepID=UPI00029F0F97|nr:serine/threonine-protein kinase [Rivularia sp. PCC 7116]AFY57795.1 serine/threonine protein kinase [Rivularia sp. PCC 7116]